MHTYVDGKPSTLRDSSDQVVEGKESLWCKCANNHAEEQNHTVKYIPYSSIPINSINTKLGPYLPPREHLFMCDNILGS